MTSDVYDEGELRVDIAGCVASHAALVEWLTGLPPVDPAAPSLLPDWSIGHVLTHIARNADSHVVMLAGFRQYPSVESRNADIETGSQRSWAELVDDVVETCRAIDAAWDVHVDWDGVALTVGGERPTALLPHLRRREVEVHRADLGLGYGFDQMPDHYVRKDLRLMEMLWRARKPMGLTPLPDAALALPPATRLAWMMGRAEIAGLAPADLF